MTQVLTENMLNWIAPSLGTLDPDFIESLLDGGNFDDLVESLLTSELSDIQQDRPDSADFTVQDCGELMDRLALFHLRMRFPDGHFELPQDAHRSPSPKLMVSAETFSEPDLN